MALSLRGLLCGAKAMFEVALWLRKWTGPTALHSAPALPSPAPVPTPIANEDCASGRRAGFDGGRGRLDTT